MENIQQQNQDLETGALDHETQESCWGQKEANGLTDDEFVFVDVKEHAKGIDSNDERLRDMETELLKYKRRCEELEEERQIWNAKRSTFVQELSTDEIIITSLKEQLRMKKKSVFELELQLKEEKEKFINSFSEMKQLRAENEQLTVSLSSVKEQLSKKTVDFAQCQQELSDLKLSSTEVERKIRKDCEQTTQMLKKVQETHEELKKRTHLLKERLETTLSENSSLAKQNERFARSLKGLKDRMKVFTHNLQSEEDDTSISQKEEEVHTELGCSLAQNTESNTDPNPIQSEPLNANISTSQDSPVPREDSIPQMMEKQEMNTPQRTGAQAANKEPEVSAPTAPMLDPIVPALSDDTARTEDFSNDSAKQLYEVVTSDLQRGSSSPDIFEAFDLAQMQMKFVRERVKKLEAALQVSESMVLREVATREAFQKQLLEIRFDKAKAFQELENLKLRLLSLESEHLKLKVKNKTLEADKDDLESKTQATDAEINQLKEQLESLKPFQLRSETAERKNYELEKELVSVQLNLEQAITTVEASKVALQEECNRFKHLSTSFTNTKIENQELKTLRNDLEAALEKNNQLSVQMDEKERQVESVKADFNQCSQRLMTAMVLLDGMDISTQSPDNQHLSSCCDSKTQTWNTVKLKLLAGQCRRLRNTIHELRSKQQQKNCILQKAFSSFRNSMEQQLSTFSSLLRQISSCSINALSHTHNEIQVIQLELGELRTCIHAMKTDLHHYQQKEKALKQAPIIQTQSTGIQCQDFTNSQWYDYLRSLVKTQTPDQPMTVSAVLETIVRVYYRRVLWMKGHSFTDDSIFDAIVCHYTSQKRQVQGLLPMNFITVDTSPISRLILNALKHSHLLKIQIFKFLLGMEESGLSPRSNTWQFFLKLLLCVFELLGESLNSTLRNWSSIEGVSLPLQCIMDVLANLYNTDNPAGLEISKTCISVLLKDSPVGPGVDFDAFVFLMLQQFLKGECPVDPLQCPRRCTDGSLPNLLNFHPGIIDLRQSPNPATFNTRNKHPAKLDIFKTMNTLESTPKNVKETQTKED